MTSQYPSKHGATLMTPPGVAGIRSGSPTLAELFRDSGYYTGAFVNNSVAGAFLTKQGFNDYDEGQKRQPASSEDFKAPATNRRVFQWLHEHSANPFFLFLLYFEPHSPYDPPPEDDLFKSGKYTHESNTGYDLNKGKLFRLANLHDNDAISRLTQLYDGKIHFIDRYIGELFAHLQERGLAGNTIVWIVSDHGELLYSHSDDYMTFDHRSLYDQVMHIPSIVIGPGIPKGKTLDALATHIDIAPTILALTGLPAKRDAQGENLVPLMLGKTDRVHDFVFGEQDVHERLRSVRDDRFKLIWNKGTEQKQLFDIRHDPEEHHDVTSQYPEVVARFTGQLNDWQRHNEPPDPVLQARWREIAEKATPAQLVVDEVTIGARFQLIGSGWKMADDPSDYAGGLYWADAVASTQPRRAAIWRSDNPLIGKYKIAIWYGSIRGVRPSTKAQLTVETRAGKSHLVVNQSEHAGQWNDLGTFMDPILVRLDADENGPVLADAVRFERLAESAR